MINNIMTRISFSFVSTTKSKIEIHKLIIHNLLWIIYSIFKKVTERNERYQISFEMLNTIKK